MNISRNAAFNIASTVGSVYVTASRFKLEIDTTKTGSVVDTFVLPLHTSSVYDCTVYWGDGSKEDIVGSGLSSVSHTYAASGIYTVEVEGVFPRIYFNNTGDRQKVMSITSWGNIAWESLSRAFIGCVNMTCDFTDRPDLTNATDVSFAFYGCPQFNCPICFNTSNVTNMSAMLFACSSFKQPLGCFHMENVTNASSMLTQTDINETGTTTNYDKTLISWASQSVQNGVVFDGGDSKYSSAGEVARNILINTYGWTITDGGLA